MKRTIGLRILLGIGVVELLALGLGLYMLFSLVRLRSIDGMIKDRDFTMLENLQDLGQQQGEIRTLRERATCQYLLRQARGTSWDASIKGDPEKTLADWRQRHREFHDLLARLGTSAAEYERGATSPLRATQWAEIARNARETEAARQAVFDAAERAFDRLASGKVEGLGKLLRQAEARRQDLDRKLAEGIELTRRQIEIGTALAGETYRRAWISAVLGLALMLALGLTAGLLIRRSITRPLGQFMQFAEEVGRGDLSRTAPPSAVTDLERLGASLDGMVAGLKELTGQTARVTHDLNAAATEILASVGQQAAATREQAAAIQQITATIEEISQSGSQIADKARQVAGAAQAASTTTVVGLQSVQAATRAMEGVREQVEAFAEHIVALSEKTQAVGEIIAAVNDLAERSNLLALNAAIEAAGAGEQGARFAVVAQEMKSLADQAKESTAQVQTILTGIQKGINSSVLLTEEAVKRAESGKEQAETSERVIHEMADTTRASVQAFQQIIAATGQQQIGFDQVTQGMKDIRQAASQTAVATTQLESAVANVNALSQQLQKAVGRYRL